MITPQDIENLAHLARIDVPESELSKLAKDMNGILGYVSEVSAAMKEAEGESDKPVLGSLRNIFREDEPAHGRGEYTEAVLANAPATENGYIKVKKIL